MSALPEKTCLKITIAKKGGGVTVVDTGRRHRWVKRVGYKYCQHCRALVSNGHPYPKRLT